MGLSESSTFSIYFIFFIFIRHYWWLSELAVYIRSET